MNTAIQPLSRSSPAQEARAPEVVIPHTSPHPTWQPWSLCLSLPVSGPSTSEIMTTLVLCLAAFT